MDAASALTVALLVLAIVLVVALLYAVKVLITSLRSITGAAEDVRTRLVPLLEKADITVDAINAELLRLDAIVTQAEGVGDAVSTASDFIRSPVSSAAQGITKLVRALGKK